MPDDRPRPRDRIPGTAEWYDWFDRLPPKWWETRPPSRPRVDRTDPCYPYFIRGRPCPSAPVDEEGDLTEIPMDDDEPSPEEEDWDKDDEVEPPVVDPTYPGPVPPVSQEENCRNLGGWPHPSGACIFPNNVPNPTIRDYSGITNFNQLAPVQLPDHTIPDVIRPRAPPPTRGPSLPDIFSPTRSPGRVTPRAPVSVPGLLLDWWVELWNQYMNPQPIPWPGRSDRRPPTNVPRTAPEEWLPREVEWPETITQLPFWGPIPDWRPATGPSPADRMEPSPQPSPSPRSTPSPRPSGSIWDEPFVDEPWLGDFPTGAPASAPARAPGRAPAPSEPEFPWPTELLPFSTPRSRPAPSPTRRAQPREPGTRTQPRTPTRPRTRTPQPFQPPTQFPEPLTADAPAAPSDPCRTAAADAKREQRRRRKECKKFIYKRIKVCQS